MPSARPLRLWLALRILLAGLVPLAVVAALVLGILLPQLRADLEIRHEALARAIAGQLETYLLGAERELRAIAQDLRNHQRHLPASHWFGHLDAHAGTGDVFAAIYIADSNDSAYAIGLPQAERGQRGDLLGLDLSKWAALREARERNAAIWSETFLSAVTGRLAVTLAIPVAEQVLVGEIAIDRLSKLIGRSPTESGILTMILDRQGQIIAHSQQAALSGQQLSLSHLPIVRDALQGRFTTQDFNLDGERFVGAPVSVPRLGWIVRVAQPRSEAFRPFLSTLWALVAGALVALLLAILVAWTLARGFASRIGRYAAQAHAIAEGDYDQPWPVSQIREFDRLAGDLERMSRAIRQRERDLATSEARYRSVIGSAPVVLFQFDERGIVTFSEGKGLAGIGPAVGEAVGQSAFELYRDYPEVCEHARQAIKGEALQFTSRIGETFFDTYFNPVRDGDGHIQVMGVAVDITERQRAEEALRQANLVVENSPVMLFRWKAEDGWPMVFVSHNVKQLGYSPDELLDKSFRFASMVYPEDLDRVGQQVADHVEHGADQFQQEYRMIAKDGTVRWVDDRTVVERDAEGRITHFQGIVIDITERKRAEDSLRHLARQDEEALRVARMGHWEFDTLTGFFTFNDQYLSLHGLTAEMAGGYRMLAQEFACQYVHPEDAHLVSEHIRQAIESTDPRFEVRAEARLLRADGEPFDVTVWFRVEKDSQGRTVKLFGTNQDITDRKRTEQKLLESESQYRELVENANSIILRWNRRGEITFINEFGLKFFGYSPEELIGQHVVGTIVPADESTGRDLRPLMDNICLHPEQFAHNVNENLRRDGERVWIDWTNKAILDERGQAIEVFSIGSDITDRQRAEAALRESEERFAKAFHLSPAPMAISEIKTDRFLDTNAQLQRMLGYSREEMIGHTSTELGVWADSGTRERMIAQLHTKGVFREMPTRFRTKTGDVREVLWSVETIRLGEQNVLLSLIFDVTERNQAEAELRRHREHLEELVAERTAELRHAMAQLVQSEKLAALGHLVAGVAHELNTPLGNARTVASALGEDLRAFATAVDSGALRRSQVDGFLNRGREAVELLERNAARAADLIGQFKQVAVDQTSVRRRRFKLRQTMEELLATLQPQFKRTAHRIELDIPPELELDSYPGPLEQVVANLVGNSLTHGFAGIAAGVIRIHTVSPDATHVQIDYLDNGIGISENVLKRIFDPFFTTKLGSGGSGLGLYIVYNIVTKVLGGTIQAHGRPGCGVTFSLVLPRTAPDPPALEIPA